MSYGTCKQFYIHNKTNFSRLQCFVLSSLTTLYLYILNPVIVNKIVTEIGVHLAVNSPKQFHTSILLDQIMLNS